MPGVREVLHATFAEHAYPPHTHDVWTLFVVDDGAVRYDLDRTPQAASPSMVSVLPPHVAHDGRPATGDGYPKRVIYLETSVLGEHLIGPAVDQPVVRDPSLRGLLAALHSALDCVDDALEAEVRLADVADRIRAALGDRPPATRDDRRDRDLAEQLRAYLDERLFEAPTMAGAAAHLDASPTRLARAFASRLRSRPTPTSTAGASRPRATGSSRASRSPMSRRRSATSTRRTSTAASSASWARRPAGSPAGARARTGPAPGPSG